MSGGDHFRDFRGSALFFGSAAAWMMVRAKLGKADREKKKIKSKEASNDEEEMYGSVKQYDRHFVVIDDELNDPSLWEKKIEKGENKVAKLYSLLKGAKEGGMIGNYMITAASFQGDESAQIGSSNSGTTTVIVYPEEKIFHLEKDGMKNFSDFVIKNSEKGQGRWSDELIESSGFAAKKVPWRVLVLVCAHKKRDALCGRIGPKLIAFLRENLDNDGRKGCQVLATSHIGGHRYAGTGIILPRATWFGRIKMHGKTEDQNSSRVVEAVLHDLERIGKEGDCRMCGELEGIEKSILRGNGNLAW